MSSSPALPSPAEPSSPSPRPRPNRRRRAVQLLVAVALLPATSLGPAALRARADDAPIRIPLHTGVAPVTLLGVSPAGLAVSQGEPDADPAAGRTVFSGAWGKPLVPRPQAAARAVGVALTGTTLAYSEPTSTAPGTADGWDVPHRLDILTGLDTTDVPGERPGSPEFADGWLVTELPSYLSSPIVYHPLSGSSRTVWSPDARQLVALDAAADGLLVAYQEYLPGDTNWHPSGPFALDLIDLASGQSRRITRGDERIQQVALSAERIAWFTDGGDVWSAARSGGTPASARAAADGVRVLNPRIAGDGTIGYLTARSAEGPVTGLRLVRRGRVTDVAVPPGSSGLDALDDDFYTASGGSASVAGVYRVPATGRTAERVAALPRPEREVTNWAFDQGVLRYLDRTGAEPDRLALWTRRVNDADGTPAVAAESADPVWLRDLTRGEQNPQMSFDAGRGAVPSQKHLITWDLLDRNRKTGVAVEQTPVPDGSGGLVHRPGTPLVSGAYVLLSGLVYRSDGAVVHTEPDAARQAGQDALFGSRLVYGQLADRGAGEVWSVDTENPEPYRLHSEAGCDRAPETAVWGGLSAWSSCDARTVTIGRVTGGGTPRSVPSGLTGAPADLGLTMHGTALGWVADGRAYLLDLSKAGSSPVRLDGQTRRMVIDGRSVVREVHRENAVPATVLQVEPLPFTSRPSLLLTGRQARLGFTPDGDGRNDTWTAQFDTTAPLSTASLRFVSARSGVPARTLTTKKVTDGSIRLVWTGRTSTGRKAPKGPYRWTLTARDTTGRRLTASGTVEIG
ncbi:hypothetical protein KIH74_09975 [Kineosporia sp. J2-2]|uniref:FlgD Ig-like domain-containing protein n=1 Tax=Kineosporia corallincola TaxID=2835133 RepID=A0ABS5TDS9_9ACTN|nr:hypothetical protein [Kineosporia corallincola]MBT0769248.1 hypothetical protein [Kineosporia corallincola]